MFQSFVYVIMPLLVMGAIIISVCMWGGGKLLDPVRLRVENNKLRRELVNSSDLLKEITGQAYTDINLKLGLGDDLMGRVEYQIGVTQDLRRKELT